MTGRGFSIDWLLLAWLMAGVPAAFAGSNWPPMDPSRLPADVKPFVGEGVQALFLRELKRRPGAEPDYLLLLQEATPAAGNDEAKRTLLILAREKNKDLLMLDRNDKLIPCAHCGGQFDPLSAITVSDGEFTVKLAGGLGWRWHNEYRFRYSTRDRFWRITDITEETFHPGDPVATLSRRTGSVGRQFGVIAFGEFDRERYLGEGFFCAFGEAAAVGEWTGEDKLRYSQLLFRRDPVDGRRFEAKGPAGQVTGHWTWDHCRVALFPDGGAKKPKYHWLIRRSNAKRLLLLDLDTGQLFDYRRVHN